MCSSALRHRIRLPLLAAVTLALLLFPVVASFSADIPIATIPVGNAPAAVAVNPLSHRVFVANYYGSTVSIIDGTSDTVTATVSTGDFSVPIAIVSNPVASPARAYVVNFWENTITVIDESSNAVVATVPSNGVHAGGPRALALNPSGTTPKLYVAEYGSGLVTVLNAETYAEIKTIAVGTYPRALGIFASAERTRIYVANRGTNTVSVIDGDTDSVVATLSVGVAPKAIAVDTSTGYAYVTNESDNSVSVIDDSDTVAATVPVGTRPIGIAVDETNGRVFVANNGSASVSVLRTSDLSLEATLSVGTNPWAIACDKSEGKAFVTNYGSGTTSVIDAALNVTSVPCGTSPYALAVDEGAAPHKTYVGDWGSDTVTVIDEPVPTALSTLALPRAFAAEDPVIVTVDPTVDTSGGTAIANGTATSRRPVYPANITAVFYRLAGESVWQRATIAEGGGTPSVAWSADVGELSDGTCEIEVVALDQTGAAAAVSDGGSAVTASSIGGRVLATLTVDAGPHATATALTLTPQAPPLQPLLTATVTCEQPDCPGPAGLVVFERLEAGVWTTIGSSELVAGQATCAVTRSTRATFRARYEGDPSHLPSTSPELGVKPGARTSSLESALMR